MTRSANGRPVLSVRDLRTRFRVPGGGMVHAVNGVGFDLHAGELLGVVGESGSGKSVTMLSLLRLLPMPPAEIVSGRALLQGEDLLALEPARLRRVRGGKVGFIFQDPMAALNPVLSVGYQLAEPLRTHLGLSRRDARRRAAALLDGVGIPAAESRLRDFPHQFSGGMRQRVMIAMAIVWVTHDLGVVAGLADRVMVMYGGQVVEQAPVAALYARPQHPYTRSLLRALPRLDGGGGRLASIPGQPPTLAQAPRCGHAFAPRCGHAFARCREENPALTPVMEGHAVACWFDADAGAPRAA